MKPKFWPFKLLTASGTGESHTVREFLAEAFGYVELDRQDHVRIDPRYYRPPKDVKGSTIYSAIRAVRPSLTLTALS